MSSWDQASRGEKIGLVWRNRKKISQIINDYLYLPFFLLIILCEQVLYTVYVTASKQVRCTKVRGFCKQDLEIGRYLS
jgi:hypothetical protein